MNYKDLIIKNNNITNNKTKCIQNFEKNNNELYKCEIPLDYDIIRNFYIIMDNISFNKLKNINISINIGGSVIYKCCLFNNLIVCSSINKYEKIIDNKLHIPIFLFKNQNFLNLFRYYHTFHIYIDIKNIEFSLFDFKIKYTKAMFNDNIIENCKFDNIYKFQNVIIPKQYNIKNTFFYSIKRNLRYMFLKIKNISNFIINFNVPFFKIVSFDSKDIKWCKNIYIIDIYKIFDYYINRKLLDKIKNVNIQKKIHNKIKKNIYDAKLDDDNKIDNFYNTLIKNLLNKNIKELINYSHLLYNDLNVLLENKIPMNNEFDLDVYKIDFSITLDNGNKFYENIKIIVLESNELIYKKGMCVLRCSN